MADPLGGVAATLTPPQQGVMSGRRRDPLLKPQGLSVSDLGGAYDSAREYRKDTRASDQILVSPTGDNPRSFINDRG